MIFRIPLASTLKLNAAKKSASGGTEAPGAKKEMFGFCFHRVDLSALLPGGASVFSSLNRMYTNSGPGGAAVPVTSCAPKILSTESMMWRPLLSKALPGVTLNCVAGRVAPTCVVTSRPLAMPATCKS